MLEQQLVNALTLGCVYALFALGFTLVFGILGVINLSHGAVFTAGAYGALVAVTRLHLPPWTAVVIAMVISGGLGALIDTMILRPLRKRNSPHLMPMIATIAVAILLNNGVQGTFGAENLRFPGGTIPDQALPISGLHVTVLDLTIILLSFGLMALLVLGVKMTNFGRAMRAVSESRKAASLLGIDVEQVFLMTSAAAGALGGAAGVLIGLYSNAVYPLMGQPMLLKGIAVIILGGMGNIPGALLGGIFLGFAEVLSVAYVGSTMRDAVAFGLLFLFLLVRPQGLFGKAVERKA